MLSCVPSTPSRFLSLNNISTQTCFFNVEEEEEDEEDDEDGDSFSSSEDLAGLLCER